MEDKFILAGFLLPHPPIVVPEVGRGQEKKAQSTINALKEAADEMDNLRPDTVVLISPHAPMFSDFVFMYDMPLLKGNLKQFGAADTEVTFEQDEILHKEIETLMSKEDIKGGSLDEVTMASYNISNTLDHGAVVPLYYLGLKYNTFKLVVLSCSGFDMQKLYKLGQIIEEAAQKTGRKIVIAASGDMSHRVNKESPYGRAPEGAQFDKFIADALTAGDIPAVLSVNHQLREKAAECGYRSLVILCGAFNGQKPQTKVLSYEAPFGIGYCVASFKPSAETAENALSKSLENITKNNTESAFVKIARQTLESYIKNGKKPSKEQFKDFASEEKTLFTDKAGVFVSIKKFGDLRGCIGTTAPTTSCIAEEIIQNAISAGTKDPRFDGITEDELKYLDISVDVLGSPQPVKSKDELDCKKYGVIVRKGYRSGLLLPDLEGVDTVDYQLEIACRKAGIDPQEDCEIYKFTITRHK